jgi:hypothetical protein
MRELEARVADLEREREILQKYGLLHEKMDRSLKGGFKQKRNRRV